MSKRSSDNFNSSGCRLCMREEPERLLSLTGGCSTNLWQMSQRTFWEVRLKRQALGVILCDWLEFMQLAQGYQPLDAQFGKKGARPDMGSPISIDLFHPRHHHLQVAPIPPVLESYWTFAHKILPWSISLRRLRYYFGDRRSATQAESRPLYGKLLVLDIREQLRLLSAAEAPTASTVGRGFGGLDAASSAGLDASQLSIRLTERSIGQ
jgi:hypothetical protein